MCKRDRIEKRLKEVKDQLQLNEYLPFHMRKADADAPLLAERKSLENELLQLKEAA